MQAATGKEQPRLTRADLIASRHAERGMADPDGRSVTVVGAGTSEVEAGILDGCPAETVGKETRVETAMLVLSEWLGSWTSVSAGGLLR